LQFQGWSTYKANGVNLGGWMEVESGNDPNIYNTLGCPGAADEWTCCETIGKAKCGAALEARYASFITPADIDYMKAYGINTIRIPTSE
jgi:glucan 1,3-beta-glucosidase